MVEGNNKGKGVLVEKGAKWKVVLLEMSTKWKSRTRGREH